MDCKQKNNTFETVLIVISKFNGFGLVASRDLRRLRTPHSIIVSLYDP